MGKTWLKILSFIRSSPTTTTTATQLDENQKVITTSKLTRGKKRWSFRKSTLQETTLLIRHKHIDDAQSVYVTTTVDEAALHHVRDYAAVSIQTVFRAYLARKALQALKGIVKLQALIRGDNVRNLTLQCRLLVQHRLLRGHRDRLSTPMIYEWNTKDNLARAFNHQTMRSNKEKTFLTNQEDEAKYSVSSRMYTKSCTDSPRTPSSVKTKPRYSSASPRRDRNLLVADQTPTYYHEMESPINPNYMAATASAKARCRTQSAPNLRRHHSVMTPEREKRTSPKKRLSFPRD